MTKWNRGTYEPEFRIPMMTFAPLFCDIEWFVFMWDLDNPTSNGYYMGAFYHGCLCYATTIGMTFSNLYILWLHAFIPWINISIIIVLDWSRLGAKVMPSGKTPQKFLSSWWQPRTSFSIVSLELWTPGRRNRAQVTCWGLSELWQCVSWVHHLRCVSLTTLFPLATNN